MGLFELVPAHFCFIHVQLAIVAIFLLLPFSPLLLPALLSFALIRMTIDGNSASCKLPKCNEM